MLRKCSTLPDYLLLEVQPNPQNAVINIHPSNLNNLFPVKQRHSYGIVSNNYSDRYSVPMFPKVTSKHISCPRADYC